MQPRTNAWATAVHIYSRAPQPVGGGEVGVLGEGCRSATGRRDDVRLQFPPNTCTKANGINRVPGCIFFRAVDIPTCIVICGKTICRIVFFFCAFFSPLLFSPRPPRLLPYHSPLFRPKIYSSITPSECPPSIVVRKHIGVCVCVCISVRVCVCEGSGKKNKCVYL